MRNAVTALVVCSGVALTVAPSSGRVDQPNERRSPRTFGLDSASLPRFDRVLLLEKSSETSANVSIGDVNGDGKPDIVLAKGRHWPLVDRVLLGDGKGHVLSAYDLGTGSDRSYSGRLADMDGDGDLDVVISNDMPDPKLVYLNDGKGKFSVGSAYGRAEWETRNASVADLNGDGQPDIVVANRTGDGPGANYICLNRGKGKFDENCIAFSHESATTITAADFDRDRRIDLAVPHRDGGQSRIYFGAANADLSHLRSLPFGPADASIRMAEAADFNGDGFTDIAAIDERRGVMIYPGQRDGTFGTGATIADGKIVPYALAVGDLNCDGKIDIVVGHVESPSTVYFNDGAGRRFTPIEFSDNKGTAYGFAISDMDGDARPDIAVARSDAPNALYFGGAGSGCR
jgi:hypothetical protein